MNALIVSDAPERKSFTQILKLKEEIEELSCKSVDLLIFSNKEIILNRGQREKSSGNAFKLLRKLLTKRSHHLIVVSLEKTNLEKFLEADGNILNLIEETVPQATVFVFGAPSVLDKVDKSRSKQVSLYYRPGVSKVTAKFKRDVIEFIESSKQCK